MMVTLKTNEGIVIAHFKYVDELNLNSVTGKQDNDILLRWLKSNIKKGQWLDQKHKKTRY